MHDWYDWLKDIGLPLLTGGGSVAVGAVAIYVARQSHELAKQVRADEGTRDAAASRERYRDQLFRTIEPAVAAILAHRAELITNGALDTARERNLLSDSIVRLRLVMAVVNDEDRPLVDAVVRNYRVVTDMDDWGVIAAVEGGLAITLPSLLTDGRDVDELIERTESFIDEAVAERSKTTGSEATD